MTAVVPSSDLAERLRRAREDPWRAFLHVEDAPETRPGPLAGLVVSVKDNLAWKGRRMTCGSKHLADYVAPYTATVVERVAGAGAVLLGKTNMDEFAAGSSGENSAFGATTNPRDPTRVPGGSSSGAAASVASGVCDAALGSDTGGSVRAPGAFCGVAAMKPSYGLVSRHGLSDLAMSLESPAPLARDVATLAQVLAAMAGPDPRDPTVRLALGAVDLERSASALRIGVVREFFEGVEPQTERAVRDALGRLADAGATLVDVDLPEARQGLAAYYLINYVEFASAMQRFDGFRFGTAAASEASEAPTRPEGALRAAAGDARDGPLEPAVASARRSFGPEVRRRILLGTFANEREHSARWYSTALAARTRLAAAVERALDGGVHVLTGPTMPFRAFPLGARVDDPLAMYAADVLTVTANLARVPAGTVPVKTPGLPIGLQFTGRHGDDATVLAAMAAAERLEGAHG